MPKHVLGRTRLIQALLLTKHLEDVTANRSLVIQVLLIVMIGTILTILGFRALASRQMIVRLDLNAIQSLAE